MGIFARAPQNSAKTNAAHIPPIRARVIVYPTPQDLDGNIHLIGGEKGGVGKSLVSRLLAQYFIDHSISFLGFDPIVRTVR